MERKTKYRILGIAVVAVIIAAALPFALGRDSSHSEAILQAPAFPEEPTQQSSNMPNETISQNVPINEEPLVSEQTPTLEQASAEENAAQPDETIPTTTDLVINEVQAPLLAEAPNVANVKERKRNDYIPQRVKTQVLSSGTAFKKKSLPQINLDKNGLAALKHPAWVVQIGSFKSKSNAIRLANKLRAKGYPAFIQQTATLLGESTRVFIGPEARSVNARQIANQVEQELHLRGLVINYKPLTS